MTFTQRRRKPVLRSAHNVLPHHVLLDKSTLEKEYRQNEVKLR